MVSVPTPELPAIVSLSSPSRLQILGDFALLIHGCSVEIGSSMAEMLALLGVAGQLSRQRIRTILWPSADPISAASRLRSLMYRLRQIAKEYEIIIAGPAGIGLNPALAVDYRIAAAAAAGLLHRTAAPPIAAAEAASLLATELLPLYSWEWLEQYQHAWSRTRLRALEACAAQALRTGDRETAIVACEAVIAAEPFHERSHYLLIIALLQEGFEQSARAIYRRLRALLADELGCAPARAYHELRAAAAAGGQ